MGSHIAEGAIYECEHSNTLVEVVHAPNTHGVPTHRLEHQPIEFETLDEGEWFSVYRETFCTGYTKVADSSDDIADTHNK